MSGIGSASRFFFFFNVEIQLFQHHLLKKTVICPLNSLCYFVKDNLTLFVFFSFLALYSVAMMYFSILWPAAYCLDSYSFIINLGVG